MYFEPYARCRLWPFLACLALQKLQLVFEESGSLTSKNKTSITGHHKRKLARVEIQVKFKELSVTRTLSFARSWGNVDLWFPKRLNRNA